MKARTRAFNFPAWDEDGSLVLHTAYLYAVSMANRIVSQKPKKILKNDAL